MKRSKTSMRFLIASLILCSAFAASVISAQAQVEPQQRAIDTSRNSSNTRRTSNKLDAIMNLIRRNSGERVASRNLKLQPGGGGAGTVKHAADLDNDGERLDSPAASTTPDENGNFTFPLVDAGEYRLTVSLPEDPKNTANKRTRGGYVEISRGQQNPAAVRFFYITLNLPGG